MFNIGPWELFAILILALIIFGPGKLPDVGKAVGKALGEFKKASKGLQDDITNAGEAPQKPKTIDAEAKKPEGEMPEGPFK